MLKIGSLIGERLHSVGICSCSAPAEFDDGVQGCGLALQCLTQQVMSFVPSRASVKLRIVHKLLGRAERLRESGLGLSSEEGQQFGKLLRSYARVNVSGSRAQQRDATQLGRVDLIEAVVVGVDVDVGQIAEIKRRH